ncbi:hypothetical protein G7054_g5472 [Neopestalotiopsis clavispora]|nr:hypothetical protein G7054_g5472 [Neopestalotiopsis clavispora]
MATEKSIVFDSSKNDVADMSRLGQGQELKRTFKRVSTLGFALINVLTWPSVTGLTVYSLINGGLAGTIWSYVFVWIMMFPVAASLGDMASMAPSSAGQYHWVSEFAPRSCQKILSYTTGWLVALGWQAALASCCYAVSCLTLALVETNNPSYEAQNWHQTLLTIAVAVSATIVNIFLTRKLPLTASIILFLFVLGFIATVVPLWVLVPKNSTIDVFTEFSNFGGWSSTGAACIIGSITSTASFFGVDGVAHMAEEIRDASWTIPRIMLLTIFLNGAMGLVAIITFVYCVTDIVDMVLENSSPFISIQVYYLGLGSTTGATALVCIGITMTYLSAISVQAAASRQAWSFARDGGLPFSSWFHKVHDIGVPVPINSILASLFITVVLSLLNLGSSAAFNASVGLTSSAGAVSYMISIGCVLFKRLRGQVLPPTRFDMGILAIPVNVVSVLFMVAVVVVVMFPVTVQPTPQSMNYGCVMFGGVAAIAIGYYFARGRNVYEGPVVRLTQDT